MLQVIYGMSYTPNLGCGSGHRSGRQASPSNGVCVHIVTFQAFDRASTRKFPKQVVPFILHPLQAIR
jgi:hypothetical protein